MKIEAYDGHGYAHLFNAKIHRIAREGKITGGNTVRLTFDDDKGNYVQLDMDISEARTLKEKLNNRKDL